MTGQLMRHFEGIEAMSLMLSSKHKVHKNIAQLPAPLKFGHNAVMAKRSAQRCLESSLWCANRLSLFKYVSGQQVI